MSHDAHAHDEHAPEVQDTLATRMLGILSGLILITALVAITKANHWHPAACSIMSGVFGVVLGAGGTSARAPMLAAYLAWTGVVSFVFGLSIFFGFMGWLF